MRNLTSLTAGLICLSFTSGLIAADGKGPPNRNNNKNRRETPQQKAREQAQKQREEAERLQKAAAELAKQEQAAFTAANQELTDARNAHRTASKALADAKVKASDQVEKSLGIEKAQAEMSQAQKVYDGAAEPVLKSVRESSAYKTAKQKSAEAESSIKPSEKTPHSAIQRNELARPSSSPKHSLPANSRSRP